MKGRRTMVAVEPLLIAVSMKFDDRVPDEERGKRLTLHKRQE